MRRGRPPYPGRLTPREQQVLELLREGLTNRQIGERLGISQSGAAYHVSEILSKLGVASREEAARLPREEVSRRLWGLAALPGLLKRPLEVAVKVSASLVAVGFVGLVVLLALGFWLTQVRGGGAAVPRECVSGELAENKELEDGSPVFAYILLETVGEAEAWLCVDLAELELKQGWEVRGVNAFRSHSLSAYEKGEWLGADNAHKYARIYYVNDDLRAYVTLFAYPDEVAGLVFRFITHPDATFEPACARASRVGGRGTTREVPVAIQGVPSTLYVCEEGDFAPSASVFWQLDGWTYEAFVSYSTGFGFEPERDFPALLESVE